MEGLSRINHWRYQHRSAENSVLLPADRGYSILTVRIMRSVIITYAMMNRSHTKHTFRK